MTENLNYLALFLLSVGTISGLGGVFFAATKLIASWEKERDLREQNARLSERISKNTELHQVKEAYLAQRHELDKKILRIETQLQEREQIDAMIRRHVAEEARPKLGTYPEKF